MLASCDLEFCNAGAVARTRVIGVSRDGNVSQWSELVWSAESAPKIVCQIAGLRTPSANLVLRVADNNDLAFVKVWVVNDAADWTFATPDVRQCMPMRRERPEQFRKQAGVLGLLAKEQMNGDGTVIATPVREIGWSDSAVDTPAPRDVGRATSDLPVLLTLQPAYEKGDRHI